MKEVVIESGLERKKEDKIPVLYDEEKRAPLLLQHPLARLPAVNPVNPYEQ